MHNVLSNFRSLSPAAASRLMQALDLSIPNLLWRDPEEVVSEVRAVPLLRNSIGPGSEASFHSFRGYLPFSASEVEGLVHPVAARLAADLVLPADLNANDVVLLDQNPAIRSSPGVGCWVISDISGLRVRFLRQGGARLYFADQSNIREPRNWLQAPLDDRNILEIVRARVVWLSRRVEPLNRSD
jgi:hypothetical protein